MFSSLKELSVLRDQLALIGHALEFNLEVLKQLSEEVQRRATIEDNTLVDRYSQLEASLRICVTEQTFSKHKAYHMGENADRLAVHVRNTPFTTEAYLLNTHPSHFATNPNKMDIIQGL
jgi:uncharacterized protein YkvS